MRQLSGMKTWLAASAMMVCAFAAQAQDVVGRYRVEGTNLDGSRYTGTAEVSALSNTTCTIRWNTGSTSSGICMRQGDIFVAGYRMGEAIGLVVYRWRNGGEYLDGTWTVAGAKGVGTERLYPR